MILHIKKIESHRGSFAKIIACATVVFCFFQNAWGSNQQDGNTWVFNKVSSVNLFGKNDREMTLQLNKLYSGVSVNTNGDVLTVNNSILEDGTVCKIKYITLNQSAVSYFYSEKTFNMYRELFKYEGLVFPENIKIFTALDPDATCSEPYNDLIEVDNVLFFSDQDYVLFLNKGIEKNLKASSERESLDSYCKNDKNTKEYDGTSNSKCFFKGLSLMGAYAKFIELNKYAGNYLQDNPSGSNITYKKNNANVSYVWYGSDELNIKLKNDNEKSDYLFLKVNDGVLLNIKIDTGY